MKNSMKATAALLLAALAAGCNDAEYDVLGTHAYISESTSASSAKVVIDAVNGATATVTVSLTQKAEKDTEFRLVADEAVMEAFNKQESSSYVTLPENVYTMAETVTVKAGSYLSDPVNIHIDPLPKELVGEVYAIPLRLESADGAVPTTSNTSKFVITTESIVMSSLPQFTSGAGLVADGFPRRCRTSPSSAGSK